MIIGHGSLNQLQQPETKRFLLKENVQHMVIRVVRPTHQNMYHQNKSNLAKINGGLEKAIFQKNASKRGEFQIVKKTTCLVLPFENVFIQPSLKHFFEKVPFLDPN